MIEKILEERQKTHGDFKDQANLAQKLKSTFVFHSRTELNNCQQEAIDMILHKLARIGSGNPNEPDHWRDIAGYATLVLKELENENT